MDTDKRLPLPLYEEVPGSPFHDFWLCSIANNPMYTYRHFVAQEAPVRLSDSVMQYVADSMAWIPSRNPAYAHVPETMGLHLYGPTIIDHTGAAVFSQVCLAWASLFSAGPSSLLLTLGSSMVLDEQGGQKEQWHRLRTDREALVQTFQRLAAYADQTAREQVYILHLGV